MSQKTSIAWTDATFSIVWGCTMVGEGCRFCYAKALAERYGFDVWGPDKPRRTFGDRHLEDPIRWNAKAAKDGKRIKVFCGSMCDVFEDHPTVEAERAKLWPLIRATPLLDWQLLTKRADRIAGCLPPDWGEGYGNVWLGVSIENNDYVGRYNDHLRKIPATVHFVSYEPALGPLDDLRWDGNLDWIIYGGESGPKFRPDDIAWARLMRRSCQHTNTAFFYKQSSGPRPGMNPTLDGRTIQEFPTPRLPLPTVASLEMTGGQSLLL